MAHKSYRDESRKDYGTGADALTHDQLQLGALLRIADATELMAKRHAELLSEVEHWKKIADRRIDMIGELDRRVSALRGVVTRQKKLVKKTEAQRDSLLKAMRQLEDMKPGILMAGVISRALEGGSE